MTETIFCILCPGRQRVPRRPPVDDACRSGLTALVGDLRIYAEQLAGSDNLVPDRRIITASKASPALARPAWLQAKDRVPYRRLGADRDPVSAALPSGSGGIRLDAAPVSGSRFPPIPIQPDRVDLTLRARQAGRGLLARGALGLDDDQVGHLPLATTLDGRVREWAKVRRETLPSARIGPMTQWLQARIEWACDVDADVEAFRDELLPYRSTMRGMLGLIDVPDLKIGVSCPKCRARSSLYRDYGEWFITCAECPAIMSMPEYLRWTKDDLVCSRCVIRIDEFGLAERSAESAA